MTDTVALIAQSKRLHADVNALWATSRALITRSRALRFAPLAWPIKGGSDGIASDVFLITTTISDARLCLDCIARKTGVPTAQANAMLMSIARSIRLGIGPHRCDGCLQHKTTFSVNKDGHAAGEDGHRDVAAAPRPRFCEALWLFLERRRGKGFCTQCLADELGVTRRIDRALIDVEGRGALRYYGPCSVCGRDRLLTALR